MPDPEKHDHSTSSSNCVIKARLLNRGVVGVACLSVISICAAGAIALACVARGDCAHWGPDACDSRKFRHQRGFEGNADFYGLGIRLGIYCQWLASIMANALLNERVRKTTTAPFIGFQIAVVAALLLLVFRTDCTFAAEVIVVIYILIGGFFIVLAPEFIQSFMHVRWSQDDQPRYRLFNTFVWILAGLMIPVSTWFWTRLATVDPARPDFYHTPGGTSMFFLAHIREPQVKPTSVLMAIANLLLGLFALEKIALACVYKVVGFEFRFIFLILLDIFRRVIKLSYVLFKSAMVHVIVSSKHDSSKPLTKCIQESLETRRNIQLRDILRGSSYNEDAKVSEKFAKMYAFALAMTSLTLSLCAIELTLAWNHITDINSTASTGQIVPLFVGLATLVSVLWEVLKKARANEKKEANLYDCEAGMWQSTNTLTSNC